MSALSIFQFSDNEGLEFSGKQIRTNEDGYACVFDLIEVATGNSRNSIRKIWSRLKEENPSLVETTCDAKFVNTRQKTPGAKWKEVIEIIQDLPGVRARQFRRKCTPFIVKHLMPQKWTFEKKIETLDRFFQNIPIDKSEISEESEIVKEVQELVGGKREVECKGGFIDLINDTHLFEMKNVINWKHALGQVLIYGLDFENHIKVLFLFKSGKNPCMEMSDVDKQFIIDSCLKYNVKVIFNF